MTTTVLLAPPLGVSIKHLSLQPIFEAIRDKGYRVHAAPIRWNGTSPEQWKRLYLEVAEQHTASRTILAGFGAGAIAALLAATEYQPCGLWLMSLPPYFADAHPLPQEVQNFLGSALVAHLSQLDINELAAAVECPTLLFAGEKERDVLEYALTIERKFAEAKVLRVADAAHSPNHPNYPISVNLAI